MEEAAQLCDRVAIMDLGRIIALGSPAALVDSLGAGQIINPRVAGQIGTDRPSTHQASLEDVFLRLTGRSLRDG
jgi:ABC-2 type transport system ATP-binding protein